MKRNENKWKKVEMRRDSLQKKWKKNKKIKLFDWDGKKKCKRNEMLKLKCLGQ